jgi:hypothetical protein
VTALRGALVASLIAMGAGPSSSGAASLPGSTRAEIDGLLGALQASSCSFNRNGTWHSADEARAHLLRKLQRLEERGAVRTAEDFVELAASNSSMSGTTYLVRCGTGEPVASGAWLMAKLKLMRTFGTGSGPAR